jgi:hypothetical protein
MSAVSSVSTQLHRIARLGDQARGDLIGDGGDKDIGAAHRLGEFALAHRMIVDIESRVEEFAHARLNEIRQPARHNDEGLCPGHFARILRVGVDRSPWRRFPSETFAREPSRFTLL